MVAGLASVASAQAPGDWPSFQGGPAHPGTAAGAVRPPLQVAWRYAPAGEGPFSAVVIAGDVAAIDAPSAVIGLDAGSGRQLWSVSRAAGFPDPAAIDPSAGKGGLVIYPEGNADGSNAIVAISLTDRKQAWRFALTKPARGALTIADQRVFFGDEDGHVYALNEADGTLAWRAATAGAVETSPAVAGGKVFAVSEDRSSGRGRLYALDESSGKRVWSYTPNLAGIGVSSASVRGDRVYAGFGDGALRAFSAGTGDLLWTAGARTAFSPTSAPVVSGDTVYVQDASGGLYAFRASSGARIWDYLFPGPSARGSALVGAGVVFAGLSDGTLAAVDISDGHLRWQTRVKGGPVGPVTPAGDLLLAPYQGSGGGVTAFRHNDTGRLVDIPSPTHLNMPRALANFAGALAIMLAVLFGFGWLERRAMWRRTADDGEAPA
jgi:outer membrane protein assembly factor BamB